MWTTNEIMGVARTVIMIATERTGVVGTEIEGRVHPDDGVEAVNGVAMTGDDCILILYRCVLVRYDNPTIVMNK